MNILWISHILPYPPKGGSLQRSFHLLKEMAKRHRIFLVAFSPKALLPVPDQVARSVEKLKEHCQEVKVLDVPCEKSKFAWGWLLFKNIFSSLPYSTKRLESKEMEESVKDVLTRQKIDLVYFDTIDLAQYAGFTGKLRAVMNHQNVESLLLRRRAERMRNPLKKIYMKIQSNKLREYERSQAEKFDLNLAVSEPDKTEFLRIFPHARVEVIPNGVDTDYFMPQNIQIKKNNLIFIGGMTWYPNRDGLLYFIQSIWPLIKEEIPEASLTLIGRKPLQKLIESSREKDLEVPGFVEDVRPYLHRANVMVVPIRVGGGTRLKILDAFACGKAVVSTSIGCEGLEVTPDNNILIGDSPEEFAGQVIKILRDDKLMTSLGSEARKLVEEKYRWETIGEYLNSILPIS
jgi:polysaccharide biosynthesis protein PslH